ncbi:CPBP family intramembrane glutamic endopeptidase [Actinopolyspora xinjiangensis]|uniref:CPBP family intramembrane glutamic endopeptidase n=1 Tax=Actinopolyspora xinjiangensis TaxID=405564 RepID=UPI00147EAD42|nr:CPBP family intramembrane glutamic endopeptidase [Actinopolyspora xinjiangensis]
MESSDEYTPGGSRSEKYAARLLAWCGLALLIASPVWLLLTGHTSFRVSADTGRPPVSLWSAMLPALVGLVLTRLVPPRMAVIEPLAGARRARVRGEMWVLVAMAVAFPVLLALLPPEVSRGAGYAVLKVVLFLVVPLAAFRSLRGTGPRPRAVSARVPRARWWFPLPAVVAWFYLSQVSVLAPPPVAAESLPDPVTLAVVSVVTLLTAGVLEEFFYRGFLQTRLERLVGRWPAILVASLLFAAMHLPTHLGSTAVITELATVLVFQGLFGVFCGYLWSRYRNIWMPVVVHILVNLAYVDLLLGWLGR